MMVGNDERRRLELMDERVGLIQMPVGIGLVPHAIEPDASDRAIVGEQFGELAVHVVIEVGIPIAVIGTAVVPTGDAAGIVVGIVPIELRIIKEELDALAVTFVSQHLQRILLVGSALNDVPVGDLGI